MEFLLLLAVVVLLVVTGHTTAALVIGPVCIACWLLVFLIRLAIVRIIYRRVSRGFRDR